MPYMDDMDCLGIYINPEKLRQNFQHMFMRTCTVFVTIFVLSGSSSRCANFQWAGDLTMSNPSNMCFWRIIERCLHRGWTRWTLAMDPKYLVCMLCLTIDTWHKYIQIPDVIFDCAWRRFSYLTFGLDIFGVLGKTLSWLNSWTQRCLQPTGL